MNRMLHVQDGLWLGKMKDGKVRLMVLDPLVPLPENASPDMETPIQALMDFKVDGKVWDAANAFDPAKAAGKLLK